MSGERLKLQMADQVHRLFSQGTLIHVTRAGMQEDLEDILLGSGLLSPCLQAERRGETISNGTGDHPEDNLYVKFLRLPSLDHRENAIALIGHFWDFADPETILPIGFIVRNSQAEQLWGRHSGWGYYPDYYGIRDQVPSEAVEGVIIFVSPFSDQNFDRLKLGNIQTTIAFVSAVLQQAEATKGKRPILDNFGREIFEAKTHSNGEPLSL